MTTSYSQDDRPIAVDTPLGKDVLLLTAFSGREEISRLYSYHLEMLSERDAIKPSEIVGKAVTVSLVNPDKDPVFFHGHVARFVHRGKNDRLNIYAAEIVPWLWFLTRMADCRIFQGKTVPQIIEKIFQDAGFSQYELDLKGKHPAWEYCVQYRETDFNFVSRLMEHEGIFYFFRHEDGKHTLVLADSRKSYAQCDDGEVVYAATGASLEALNDLTNWEHGYEYITGKIAQTDYNFETPTAPLMTKTNTLVQLDGISKHEVYDYPGEYEKKDQGQDDTNVRMEEHEAGYDVISAAGRCRSFKAGSKFKVTKHQSKAEEGKSFVVTAIQHHASVGAYLTGCAVGAEYTNTFTCIPDTVTYRPQRITPKPLIHGLQTAVVVGPPGEEIYTDKYGRIKVQFHWDREGKKDDHSSIFLRVAQTWAGIKWGSIYLPRIGMEVLVQFLEGDPDRPLVSGCVYNAQQMPPYPLPEHMTMSTTKSMSTKGGDGFNEIRFEDKKGHEQVFVHSQRNMDVRIRNNFYETNYGNREVRVGWDKDGESGGDYNTFIKSNENTHVKKARYDYVEMDVDALVDGHHYEGIKNSWAISADKLVQINSDGMVVETVSGISHKTKDYFIEAAGAAHIRAGTLSIEATTSISMSVGGNFVVINSSGVSINGTIVMINSGGAPSPSQPAKAAQSLKIEEPIDAAPADDGKPGRLHSGAAAPRQHNVRTLDRKAAPPWIPPVKAPSIPPPVVIPPGSTRPCGIAKLTVSCGHESERVAGPSNILQVVPDAKTTTKVSREFVDGLVDVSASKKSGGQDSITVKCERVSDSASGRLQSAILRAPAPPSDGDWNDNNAPRSQKIPAPTSDDFWPGGSPPEVYYIYGRGCDDFTLQTIVECYPSQQHEASISLTIFKSLAEKLNDWLEEHCKNSWGGVSLGISLEPPSGELSAEYGWKEKDDWQAAFSASLSAEVTLFVITIEGKWNLRDTALKLTLSTVGIPPPISNLIVDIASEAMDDLAQIFVKLSLSGSPKLTGEMSKEWPASSSTGTSSGSCKVQGAVTLELQLFAQIGSEKTFAYVKLDGKGSTGINFDLDLSLEKDGVWGAPHVEFPGLTFSVEAALTVAVSVVGWKVSKEKQASAEWKAIGERTLYPTGEDKPKWHLIGPSSSS